MRSESEDGKAGFEDRCEGLHAVGDTGDNEIGRCGNNLFSIGSPTVVDDGKVHFFQFRDGFEAVFCAGAKTFEAVQGGDGKSNGGLKGGYSHQELSIALPGTV